MTQQIEISSVPTPPTSPTVPVGKTAILDKRLDACKQELSILMSRLDELNERERNFVKILDNLVDYLELQVPCNVEISTNPPTTMVSITNT